MYHLAMKTVTSSAVGELESLTTTGYLGVENGFLVTGTLGAAPVRIYKLDSRPGDSWLCTDPRLKDVPDRTFTHLRTEAVAVPAGLFKNARHIQVVIRKDAGTYTGDFYIVPGIGIVKTEALAEGDGPAKRVLLELESFSSPGEF